MFSYFKNNFVFMCFGLAILWNTHQKNIFVCLFVYFLLKTAGAHSIGGEVEGAVCCSVLGSLGWSYSHLQLHSRGCRPGSQARLTDTMKG